jgi:DNA-binding transcriptional LysR family regulator
MADPHPPEPAVRATTGPSSQWWRELVDARLRCVCAVAEHGSFTKAAVSLYMTQSGVSFHIRNLERQLGEPLFHRGSREVRLTSAGRRLVRYAEQVFELTERTADEFAASRSTFGTSITIGVTAIIASKVLPSLLKDFLADRPPVIVSCAVAGSGPVMDAVADGAAEVGIVADPITREDLDTVPVLNDRLAIITPPDHPWLASHGSAAGGAPLDLRELAAEPLVLREARSGTRLLMDRFFHSHGLHPRDVNVAFEINTFEGMVAAVKAGFGVTIGSPWALAGEIARGEVGVVAFDDEMLARSFYLIWPKQRQLRHITAELIAHTQRLAPLENWLAQLNPSQPPDAGDSS